MKLNDLINKDFGVIEEDAFEDDSVLFEDEELNEVYKGKRYFKDTFKADVDKFLSKADAKTNPFAELAKSNKLSTMERDLGSEVKGLPNAKEIMSLGGDYKNYMKNVKDLADQFDKWKKETGTKVARTTDDDAAAHKTMPKKVKEELNKFYSQYKHYAKLLPTAVEKAKKIEPKLAETKNKVAMAGRVKDAKDKKVADRKESVSTFKSNVKKKVSNKVDGAKKFNSDFKNKVKGMAGAVNFKKEDEAK